MHKEKEILLVEDDKEYRLGLCQYLAGQGFFVYATENLDEVKKILADSTVPDIVLIDKNLNGENGFDLIHFIRNSENIRNIPIIVVTADTMLDSRLEAFKLGADDLLVKPFDLAELESRIHANLRRSGSYQVAEQFIDYQSIHINLRSHEVFIDEQKVALTNMEYKILLELVSRKNEVVHREKLVSKVLSLHNSSARTLDVHMNSLRKKLGEKSSHIKTIRGRGYMFRSA